MQTKPKSALRLIVYLPHAHWRVPFTYQRRHTLALPPYSTVIGLLCNLLGIRNLHRSGAPCQCEYCINIHHLNKILHNDCQPHPSKSLDAILYHELTHNLELAILGTFRTKTSEYVWFRNLNKDNHKNRFGSVNNRTIDGIVEHPGGQSPVTIDILNDVHLIIYFAHRRNCQLFLHLIQYAFRNGGDFSLINDDNKNFNDFLCNASHVWSGYRDRYCKLCQQHPNSIVGIDLLCASPKKCSLCQYLLEDNDPPVTLSNLRHRHRLGPLHIGRAEDWFRIEDLRIVELESKPWLGRTHLYTWIPETAIPNGTVAGLYYRVPTFYTLKDQRRLFRYEKCFLNDGDISDSTWDLLVDEHLTNLPEELSHVLHIDHRMDRNLPVFFQNSTENE